MVESAQRVLVIGDPHFKVSNVLETDQMVAGIVEIATRESFDFIVVLGDILDRHEAIHVDPLCRATYFLEKLRPLSKHLFILIGNHDRPNNTVYLTTEHPFNALHQWEQTTVVDKVVMGTGIAEGFLFVPYVEAGRLDEALQTIDCGIDSEKMATISGVFAHQEFHGARMNAITSHSGDVWPLEAPPCISGHIHDFHELQSNLIYAGTPIQHGFADTRDKKILVAHFHPNPAATGRQYYLHHYERIPLNVVQKLHIHLSLEELSVYEPPENTIVKITVNASAAAYRNISQLAHVKALVSTGRVKIQLQPIEVTEVPLTAPAVAIPFKQRLADTLATEPPVIQEVFRSLFHE